MRPHTSEDFRRLLAMLAGTYVVKHHPFIKQNGTTRPKARDDSRNRFFNCNRTCCSHRRN